MKTLLVVLGIGAGGAVAYYCIQQNKKIKLIDALSVDLSDAEKQGAGLASLKKMTVKALKEYQLAVNAKKKQLVGKITDSLPDPAAAMELINKLSSMTAQELVDIDNYITWAKPGSTDPSMDTRIDMIFSKYGIKGS